MKKLLFIFLILMISGCATTNKVQNTYTHNNVDEVSETVNESDSYTDIVSNERFIHLNNYEMNSIFADEDDDFTGIVVMSKESCHWCQRLLPVIHGYVLANDKQIYYIDTEAVKAEESFDSNVAFNNVSENIQELLIEAGAPISDDGKASLRIPLIVAFNNGTPVKARLGVLDEYDDTEIPLTYDQKGQIQHELDQLYSLIK